LKLPSSEIKKIAIFRALQLGDMLCAVPAFRALRHAYPDAEIVLLGLPWAESFVKRFSNYFDRFIHFPGYPGLPEQPFSEETWQAFKQHMQEEKFDLLLQMQGNGTIVNAVMFELGAKHVAGYHNTESRVDSGLFVDYPDCGHEAERHLVLMQHLGIESQGTNLEFPTTQEEENALTALRLPIRPKRYVCVHPGSRGAWRQWPPEYFAKLSDECAEKGYQIVVTGTVEEKEITSALISYLRHPAIDLTGKTSMGAVACLIKDAFLLIANCTGVSHISSATKTPSLIISMDGEPERWGPLDHSIHVTIDWTKEQDFEKVRSLLTTTFLQ
jgi:ADP-heptose:LPS heptosyltransferase